MSSPSLTLNTMPPPLEPTCVYCLAPSKLRCSRCHAKYCSFDCQINDFYFHRWLCRPLVEKYSPSQRPRITSFRCVFFPVRSNKPKWTWFDPEDPEMVTDFFGFDINERPVYCEKTSDETTHIPPARAGRPPIETIIISRPQDP